MSRLDLSRRNTFLKTIIREYYSRKPLEEPSELHKREIALESLEDGMYIRHLSFPYMHSLYNYITREKTPLHLYYSVALYTTPNASKMEDKGFEGAELMFDIDADKYPDCVSKTWICTQSGEVYTEKIEKCKSGEKPVEYSSINWECIKTAWNGVLKIIDALNNDYGFTRFKVYFSGNRGFHVKVYDQDVFQLTRDARRAIAGYISCKDLNKEALFPVYRDEVLFMPPEYGIRRRVYEEAKRQKLLVKKEVRSIKGFEALKLEYLDTILSQVCIPIDEAVTIDTSRLSRFGNSLNMKAGFKVTELNVNTDIENLDFSSFTPFKGHIKTKSLVSGSFNVLGKTLSLSRGEVYKFEAYIGVYLVVKGIALPLDYSELEVKP